MLSSNTRYFFPGISSVHNPFSSLSYSNQSLLPFYSSRKRTHIILASPCCRRASNDLFALNNSGNNLARRCFSCKAFLGRESSLTPFSHGNTFSENRQLYIASLRNSHTLIQNTCKRRHELRHCTGHLSASRNLMRHSSHHYSTHAPQANPSSTPPRTSSAHHDNPPNGFHEVSSDERYSEDNQYRYFLMAIGAIVVIVLVPLMIDCRINWFQSVVYWTTVKKYLADIHEMDQKIAALYAYLDQRLMESKFPVLAGSEEEDTDEVNTFNEMLLRFLLYDREKLKEQFCEHHMEKRTPAESLAHAVGFLFSMSESPLNPEDPLWRYKNDVRFSGVVPALIQALESHLKSENLIAAHDNLEQVTSLASSIDAIIGQHENQDIATTETLLRSESNAKFLDKCIKTLHKLSHDSDFSAEIVRLDGIPMMMKLRHVAPNQKQALQGMIVHLLADSRTHRALPEEQLLNLISETTQRLRKHPDEEEFLANVIVALGKNYHREMGNIQSKSKIRLKEMLGARLPMMWIDERPGRSGHIFAMRPYLVYRIHNILAGHEKYLSRPELLEVATQDDFLADTKHFSETRWWSDNTRAFLGGVALAAFSALFVQLSSNPRTLIYVVRKRRRVAANFILLSFWMDNGLFDVLRTSKFGNWANKHLFRLRMDIFHVYAMAKLFFLLKACAYYSLVVFPILVGIGCTSYVRQKREKANKKMMFGIVPN